MFKDCCFKEGKKRTIVCQSLCQSLPARKLLILLNLTGANGVRRQGGKALSRYLLSQSATLKGVKIHQLNLEIILSSKSTETILGFKLPSLMSKGNKQMWGTCDSSTIFFFAFKLQYDGNVIYMMHDLD